MTLPPGFGSVVAQPAPAADNAGMPSRPDASSAAIVLATLNAKYIHTSLGLRCLLANMDAHGGAGLRAQTQLREFVIEQPATQIVEALLALSPRVIGLGVYIWNVVETTQVVRLLKALRPDIRIVLGGPEVSFETAEQAICALADHVITGWGDVSFPKLCRALLDGPQPLMKTIAGEQPPLSELALPYREYTDADLAQRLVYVEASRGCPFKCEFCLSSLDKTAWAFELDRFMAEMQTLYARGARNFKFVDRTFNLKVDFSVRILQFFLDRIDEGQHPAQTLAGAHAAAAPAPGLFVHFEVVPDSLPDKLKALIARFPAGTLQFEVGIQSFNPEVQQRISRRQDNAKTADNLRWLVSHSQAHVHADLIFGLPGETLQSFAEGFDKLHALGPHEIQFGVLKRLRGTPITRHTQAFAMVYDPQTPYTILQNSTVGFSDMQRIKRFARYWEMLANSGRFTRALQLLLVPGSAFNRFLAFSDWLWQRTGKTHAFAYDKLLDGLHAYLTGERQLNDHAVRQALLADYQGSGARGRPACLAELLAARRASQPPGGLAAAHATPHAAPQAQPRAQRQARHLAQALPAADAAQPHPV